jgi:hypothetical protein
MTHRHTHVPPLHTHANHPELSPMVDSPMWITLPKPARPPRHLRTLPGKPGHPPCQPHPEGAHAPAQLALLASAALATRSPAASPAAHLSCATCAPCSKGLARRHATLLQPNATGMRHNATQCDTRATPNSRAVSPVTREPAETYDWCIIPPCDTRAQQNPACRDVSPACSRSNHQKPPLQNRATCRIRLHRRASAPLRVHLQWHSSLSPQSAFLPRGPHPRASICVHPRASAVPNSSLFHHSVARACAPPGSTCAPYPSSLRRFLPLRALVPQFTRRGGCLPPKPAHLPLRSGLNSCSGQCLTGRGVCPRKHGYLPSADAPGLKRESASVEAPPWPGL